MRRFFWRLRLFNALASWPFGWSWPSAWDYAKTMAETYYDDDPEGWACPIAALDEDRTYWDS